MAQETTVAVKINASTGGTESVKSLKAQIAEATNEATRLAEEFGKFSPQAIEAAKKAADLKQQMGDVQKNIAAIGANKFEKIAAVIGGMARGIQAAQGAMALFGSESEDLQKTLVKVQGAMAFAEGIAGLIALKGTFLAFQTTVIAGFRSMAAALTATGVGAIIVAIGVAISAVIVAMNNQSRAQRNAAHEADNLSRSLDRLKTSYDSTSKYIEIASQTEINALELAGAQRSKIISAQLEGISKAKKANQEYQDDVLKQSEAALKRLNKDALGEEEYNKKTEEIRKKRDEQFEASVKKTEALMQSERDLNHEKNVAIKQENEKAIADAQAAAEKNNEILQARNENERNALLDLNEEKRKLKEVGISDEIVLEQIKLENELERLGEQRENALRAENLTKKAIADINSKFDLSEQIARQNSAKAIAVIEKERTAKEKAELEERRAAREKFIEDSKAITQKEIADTIAATDKLYANKKNQLTLQGAAQAEFDNLEIKRLEAQLQNAKDYGELTKDETLRIEAELYQKKKDMRDKDAANEKAARDASIEISRQGFAAIAQLADSFAGQSEEQQKKAFQIKKAASIAQTLIETYQAAQSAYASQMTIPTPEAPIRAAVAAGIAIASGLARVAAIQKTKFEGGNGGSKIATPNAPQTTPLTGGTLPDTEAGQFAGMGKVYVLEGDITKTQTRVRRVRNVSVV